MQPANTKNTSLYQTWNKNENQSISCYMSSSLKFSSYVTSQSVKVFGGSGGYHTTFILLRKTKQNKAETGLLCECLSGMTPSFIYWHVQNLQLKGIPGRNIDVACQQILHINARRKLNFADGSFITADRSAIGCNIIDIFWCSKKSTHSHGYIFYAVNWCVSRWNGRDTTDVIIFFISRPGG